MVLFKLLEFYSAHMSRFVCTVCVHYSFTVWRNLRVKGHIFANTAVEFMSLFTLSISVHLPSYGELLLELLVLLITPTFFFFFSPQPRKESLLFPILVISRVVFIPLLMLCNVQVRSYMPVYFPHDAAFTAIMTFFSVSSGYFVCLSMSYAPQWVETEPTQHKVASVFKSMSL